MKIKLGIGVCCFFFSGEYANIQDKLRHDGIDEPTYCGYAA